jgi:GDSL-like Lipase/Acylhydrolase family
VRSKKKAGRPLIISKPKKMIFATILICSSLAVVLAAGETFLRYRKQLIRKSDALDPGLIIYDRYLGWTLASNWQGSHHHHDFYVRYTTNTYGFRGRVETPSGQNVRRYAFVGDSFTFGLGVNDEETFVQLLNSRAANSDFYLNFAVPGFSTDQEYLLIRRRVFDFKPAVIVLVTYLGNDLFDNQLPFPLQADNAKPYFEPAGGKLILKNSPVPLKKKSDAQAAMNLRKVVMGDAPQPGGRLIRTLKGLELFQVIEQNLPANDGDLFGLFENRFKNVLQLFDALLEHIRNACRQHDVGLVLVLMPGRSLVERPVSHSAQFQEYLRAKLVENSRQQNIAVLDLASHLKTYHRENDIQLFHPNEGHLTVAGHRVTADFIQRRLKTLPHKMR